MVKLSGLNTAAAPGDTSAALQRYVDHALDVFGPDRMMYGGTAADAHRQIGFIAWVRLHDRERCERNYEAAQRIANEHSLAKEVGAIHKELAWLLCLDGGLALQLRSIEATIQTIRDAVIP